MGPAEFLSLVPLTIDTQVGMCYCEQKSRGTCVHVSLNRRNEGNESNCVCVCIFVSKYVRMCVCVYKQYVRRFFDVLLRCAASAAGLSSLLASPFAEDEGYRGNGKPLSQATAVCTTLSPHSRIHAGRHTCTQTCNRPAAYVLRLDVCSPGGRPPHHQRLCRCGGSCTRGQDVSNIVSSGLCLNALRAHVCVVM